MNEETIRADNGGSDANQTIPGPTAQDQRFFGGSQQTSNIETSSPQRPTPAGDSSISNQPRVGSGSSSSGPTGGPQGISGPTGGPQGISGPTGGPQGISGPTAGALVVAWDLVAKFSVLVTTYCDVLDARASKGYSMKDHERAFFGQGRELVKQAREAFE